MSYFNDKDKKWIQEGLKNYPENQKRSMLIPLLHYAQDKNGGWLSNEALKAVEEALSLKAQEVMEVVTFYSQFHLKKTGKYKINVCTTVPCCLLKADELFNDLKEGLEIENNEVTQDGLISIHEVECLGACANGPVAQINENYYEDLTKEKLFKLIDDIKSGKELEEEKHSSKPCESNILKTGGANVEKS